MTKYYKSTGLMFPDFETLDKLDRESFRQSILSPVASPVKTSVTLASVPALKASRADYGLSSPASFANFDPNTSSWKTSRRSLRGELIEFSGTWPQAGMMRNGTAYRLRPSAPLIYELASGFLPTPVASESKRGATTPYSQGGYSLSFALGGRPNPRFVEWMMGFPDQWTDLEG